MDLVWLYNSTVCRVCGEENENGTLLYSKFDGDQDLSDIINKYLPLQVSDDGQLPRTVCPGCTIQIEATVEFINLIIKGQKIIRELHQREKEYKKESSKTTTDNEVITEKIVYEINTSNGIYQVEHPISLQVAGLEKPKRKRGRPPKKPKTPEELEKEQEERAKLAEAESEKKDETECNGKRRRKTPTRFKEAVQGKELEKMLIAEGLIESDEAEPESKPVVPKVEVPQSEPEVIGLLETKGEVVEVVQRKGRGRPKGRLRPTREECMICGMEFSCSGRYMAHVAQHGPVTYQCKQCSKGFPNRIQFNEHQTETGHAGQNIISYDEAQKPNEKPVEIDPLKIESEETKKTNGEVEQAPIEVGSSNDEVEPGSTDDVTLLECTAEETPSSQAEDSEVESVEDDYPLPDKKKYKCNFCEKMFSSNQGKSLHIKAFHKGERPYKCNICGVAFPYPRSLALHRIRHRAHTKNKYACDLCSKVFNHPSSVTYHRESVHGNLQYNCLKCGRCFKHKQLLQRHQLVHTHERPYRCEYQNCNASFKTRTNLVNHELLHTGLKRYSCDICKQNFAHKPSLTLHMRIHSGVKPYSCPHCSKAFSQKGNLVEHLRIHTGERPFQCSHCRRSFRTSSQLRMHLIRHNNQEETNCHRCALKFSSRDELREHIKKASCPLVALPKKYKGCKEKQKKITNLDMKVKCNRCNKVFSDEDALDKHVKQIHKQISLLNPEKTGISAIATSLAKPVEDVIYVTYQAPNGQYQIVKQEDILEDSSRVLFDGTLVLNSPEDLNEMTEDNTVLIEDEPQYVQNQSITVTDEHGNPIQFTMQDGTHLSITSTDGKTLEVITQDGQRIPVELNSTREEVSNDSNTIVHHLNIQNKDNEEQLKPVTQYYTIV